MQVETLHNSTFTDSHVVLELDYEAGNVTSVIVKSLSRHFLEMALVAEA